MPDEPKTLTPRLRFPEFSDKLWEQVNGNELFDLIDRRPAPPGLPILAITQEQGPVPRDQIDYHVSVTDNSVASYKEVQPADFIISLRSFQGGIEYSYFHGICSPAYLILRRKGEGDDHFYRHLFKSDRFIQQITRNIEGIRDGKMISYKQFSEQLLPNPDLAEQRKIAACLTSLDELIAAEGRKLEALRDFKKGLLQNLFPRPERTENGVKLPAETTPRLRFPEFRNAGEWELQTLEDLCKAKISYGIVQAGPHVPDGMPYIKSTDLNAHLRLSGLARTAEAIAHKYRRSEVVPGDIVISLRGNIGSARIVPTEIPVANLTQGTARIRTRGPSDFVLQSLQSEVVLRRLLAVSKGSALREISLESLRAVPLPTPREDEQHCIASFLSSLDTLITNQTTKLDTLKAHKQGLMQQLFPTPEAIEGR